jgi:hypothetical protein
MKKALFLTAYNRPAYLQQVLHSWETVRGLRDWHFVAMIEPSPFQWQIKEELELFVEKAGLTDYEILINPVRYGVLHHPWVGFTRLLLQRNFDFVVRAEDDLIVSDDILEYFSWAAERYRYDEKVATVQAFTQQQSGNVGEVMTTDDFSPLVWGTWRSWWDNLLGPTWDHDYSTNNGVYGQEAGWDWNINTRIFPAHGLKSIVPGRSRVDNIGQVGTHSDPRDFVQAPTFEAHRDPVAYYSGR